ncbi:hypothetical protein C8N24_2146 [Solirubrobacter pauli]|uniref:Uncharacterized protein n=1 Tax=Solirubrobacter pauli TaxID=166793 RepID=A0A660LBB7_9ACTN|nr:hypothetical protein [Solirubrobacter pauli]RKQ92302.1 hypothetical protein C8N24_2146 [Solirubrobacter pauli]
MLRAALLTLLVLLILPAAADAACRTVPTAAVYYDSPAVRVAYDGKDVVACLRATRTERVVAPEDDYLGVEITGVDGDRWLTYSTYVDDGSKGQSRPYTSDVMLDLQTGVTVSENGDEWFPGGELASRYKGLVAYYADGRSEVLDPGHHPLLDEYARHGRRIYWQSDNGRPKTALIDLPGVTPLPAGRPVRATAMAGCPARRGARLVARFRRLVVTRKGRDTRVCLKGRTTRLGDVTGVEAVSGYELAYVRPGYAGHVNAVTGVRHELPRAQGQHAARLRTVAARDRYGVLRAWSDVGPARILTTAPARSVAVSPGYVYWLAADGTPRAAKIRRNG